MPGARGERTGSARDGSPSVAERRVPGGGAAEACGRGVPQEVRCGTQKQSRRVLLAPPCRPGGCWLRPAPRCWAAARAAWAPPWARGAGGLPQDACSSRRRGPPCAGDGAPHTRGAEGGGSCRGDVRCERPKGRVWFSVVLSR